MRLVADFLRLLNGETPSLSATSLFDSINGHMMGFCAERSMETGEVVEISTQASPDQESA
jgi:hypothetical protein